MRISQSKQEDNAEHTTVDLGECPECSGIRGELFLSAPDRFHGRSEVYKLLRCPRCCIVWLRDPPPPEAMGLHYGADYDRAIAGGGEDPSHWLDRRDTLLRYSSAGAVLDLGCSSGGFLSSLKGPGWDRFGIEMSETVAKRAEQRCGAQVFVGDILDAPFAPGSFDAVTCFHVFEHLYQPKEVLARVSEWLKPGGIFYTMMPNIESAGARIFRSYWYALELPRHLYHFSPASLRTLASSVGFEEVSLTTHREVFIELSTRYILDDMAHRIGMPRAPLAKAKVPGIPWKIVRKMLRLTILPVLTGLASFAGDGESLDAVFRKTR